MSGYKGSPVDQVLWAHNTWDGSVFRLYRTKGGKFFVSHWHKENYEGRSRLYPNRLIAEDAMNRCVKHGRILSRDEDFATEVDRLTEGARQEEANKHLPNWGRFA